MTSQPIGLSDDLAPRQVMRAIVGQHDIAVWRSVSGVVSAWHNRCPHRGMRLSHGFVRGESLACAYHGWHFNCEGYCHYIPAHPELNPPKTVRPTIYSVVEHGGLIWVDPEHEAQAVSLPEDTTPVRSLTFACDTDSAVQSLTTVPREQNAGVASLHPVSDNPSVLSTDAFDISDGIIIALQQPEANRVNVHVLVRKAVTVNERIAISRWLESARRYAENSQDDNR